MRNSIKLSFLSVLICTKVLSSTGVSHKTLIKNTKKKLWNLEFLLATEQTRDIVSKKEDGTYSKFDISLLQSLKANPNNEFRYFLSTRYVDTKSEEFGNKFELFFAELMYRKKNILTENDHGINLEAEIKNYQIIDNDIKERYGYKGALIPQVIIKKSFNRKTGVKLKLRRHFYQTHLKNNYTLNFEDRVYLSYSKFLGRRFLLNTQLKYQHKIRKGNGLNYRYMELASYNPLSNRMDFSQVPTAKKHQELLTLHPGILYFFNRKNMMELYLETKLSDTYDKRDLATISKEELVIGTAFYLTAF